MLICIFSVPAEAITYRIQTLDYPGATDTSANGIYKSNIVGYYYDEAGIVHGFLYDGTNWSTLDYPGAAGSVTAASGIYKGNIVGCYYDEAGIVHGFLYDGMNWSTLDYPGVTNGTEAYGIYKSNIVGYYYDEAGIVHGFLYDGTNWSTLDYPGVAGSVTAAYGIYEGNIVGGYSDAQGKGHGFLYDGTNWSTLDYPGVTNGTEAYGIYNGNIVGYYYDVEVNEHGFLATPKQGQQAKPVISVSPMSANFGSVPVGSPSNPKTVTIKNAGNDNLTIYSITIIPSTGSEFSQTNNCDTTISAGSSCTITVTFTPEAFGKKRAKMSISSNDPKSPTVNVKLLGKGK
jgi:hypothetical protein